MCTFVKGDTVRIALFASTRWEQFAPVSGTPRTSRARASRSGTSLRSGLPRLALLRITCCQVVVCWSAISQPIQSIGLMATHTNIKRSLLTNKLGAIGKVPVPESVRPLVSAFVAAIQGAETAVKAEHGSFNWWTKNPAHSTILSELDRVCSELKELRGEDTAEYTQAENILVGTQF